MHVIAITKRRSVSMPVFLTEYASISKTACCTVPASSFKAISSGSCEICQTKESKLVTAHFMNESCDSCKDYRVLLFTVINLMCLETRSLFIRMMKKISVYTYFIYMLDYFLTICWREKVSFACWSGIIPSLKTHQNF